MALLVNVGESNNYCAEIPVCTRSDLYSGRYPGFQASPSHLPMRLHSGIERRLSHARRLFTVAGTAHAGDQSAQCFPFNCLHEYVSGHQNACSVCGKQHRVKLYCHSINTPALRMGTHGPAINGKEETSGNTHLAQAGRNPLNDLPMARPG
jgi:hypothetical protein